MKKIIRYPSRLDSDFARPYGWLAPKGMDISDPPSLSKPYNLSYPVGNPILIDQVVQGLEKENKTRKLAAW